jgi:putative phage-type endonuclease
MTFEPLIKCDIDAVSRRIDEYVLAYVKAAGNLKASPRGLFAFARAVAPSWDVPWPAWKSRMREIMANRARLTELRKLPLVPQRSPEWYELRKKRITASDTAQAIGQGKYGSRAQLIQRKVAEGLGHNVPFVSAAPMIWGTMFEDMAQRCYSQYMNDVHVYEFGCLPHPTCDFFGASPDGITELGTMIEIKCPWKRKMTGEIPEHYHMQMLGQMAVCDISECDYIECEMRAIYSSPNYLEAVGDATSYHGVIVETRPQFYEYSPAGLTGAEALAWASKYEAVEAVHRWHLVYMHIQRVRFDAGRWGEILEKLAHTHKEIQGHIQAGCVPEITTKKRMLTIKESPPKARYQFLEDSD